MKSGVDTDQDLHCLNNVKVAEILKGLELTHFHTLKQHYCALKDVKASEFSEIDLKEIKTLLTTSVQLYSGS